MNWKLTYGGHLQYDLKNLEDLESLGTYIFGQRIKSMVLALVLECFLSIMT